MANNYNEGLNAPMIRLNGPLCIASFGMPRTTSANPMIPLSEWNHRETEIEIELGGAVGCEIFSPNGDGCQAKGILIARGGKLIFTNE